MNETERRAIHSTTCVVCKHPLLDHHYWTLRCQCRSKPRWWSRSIQCPCEMRPA